MVDESHPAIVALGRMFHVTGRSSIHLSNNLLNGFYLPDGIVLKMAV
ncbi:MAG: hypothetical protein JWP49_1945 [Phenylobacterium sp.]|nr:hypothetical protein [Phenylobacterium sp.]